MHEQHSRRRRIVGVLGNDSITNLNYLSDDSGVLMPYVPHIKSVTTFGLGDAGAQVETATCSLSWEAFSLTPAGLVTLTNLWYTDWATWLPLSGSKVLGNVSLLGVKTTFIGADGKMVGEPVEKLPTGSPVVGNATPSSGHPWQDSIVLTFVCGAAGKGRLGRIFLPPMAFQMQSDGTINSADHTSIFNGLKTLMNNLAGHTVETFDIELHVAGKTGTGTLRPVTSLRFGKACDTQRRRRRNLDEAYVSAAFPT